LDADYSKWWKAAYDDTFPELIVQRGGRASRTFMNRSHLARQLQEECKAAIVRTGGPQSISGVIGGALRAIVLHDHLAPDTFDILYQAAPIASFKAN
jgi:hypothetical protein